MICISIILAAIIGPFVLGLGDSLAEENSEKIDINVEFTETESGLHAELVEDEPANDIYIYTPNSEKKYWIHEPDGSVTIPAEELQGESQVQVVVKSSFGAELIAETQDLETNY
jgi:FlaG/FlaF family flagellin (archaellin)